jgi:hypothetical protein
VQLKGQQQEQQELIEGLIEVEAVDTTEQDDSNRLKRLSVPSVIEKLYPAFPSTNHPTKPELFE